MKAEDLEQNPKWQTRSLDSPIAELKDGCYYNSQGVNRLAHQG